MGTHKLLENENVNVIYDSEDECYNIEIKTSFGWVEIAVNEKCNRELISNSKTLCSISYHFWKDNNPVTESAFYFVALRDAIVVSDNWTVLGSSPLPNGLNL